MIFHFTFTNAKAFFTTHDILDIRKATKGMTPDDVFAWLNIKTDETQINEYAQLAATMVVAINV